jgi:hypothetical protein
LLFPEIAAITNLCFTPPNRDKRADVWSGVRAVGIYIIDDDGIGVCAVF